MIGWLKRKFNKWLDKRIEDKLTHDLLATFVMIFQYLEYKKIGSLEEWTQWRSSILENKWLEKALKDLDIDH